MLWGWMQEGSGYISFLCVKSTKSPLTQMDAFRPLSQRLKAEGTKINEMVFHVELFGGEEEKEPQTEEH